MRQYGVEFPDSATPASLELALAFRPELYVADGWLGRYQHLRNAVELIWNQPNREKRKALKQPYDARKHDLFIWHDWAEQEMELLCESFWASAITGPNASGKTVAASLYGLLAFYASPHNTSVVMTTTTLDGIKKRLWRWVMYYHNAGRTGIGSPHSTDHALRFKRKEDKASGDQAGVFCVATGQTEGEVDKAIGKIIGYHNTHVVVIIDEAQATNEALRKGCVSLEAGAETFQLIEIGNIDSELSPFGQSCEPVDGWGSITVDTGKWETKRGACVHFDGLKSPAIAEGDGYYPGLLTQRDIESAKQEHGEDSPWFWQFRRGFPPPQGILKTVLSAPMITRGRAMEAPIWQTSFAKGVALDPAYGDGDRCALQLWQCGTLDDGIVGMSLLKTELLKLSASSREPIHFQIARLTMEFGVENGVKPEMCAIDSTAEGGGVWSILREMWGGEVLGVEFGGRPSSQRLSDANPKRADELYDRKVTELYFRFQDLVRNSQVRGLDRATANEFCLRQYSTKAYGVTAVETKDQMKKRTNGRSSDLSDAAVIAAELFRIRGLLHSPTDTVNRSTSWFDLAKDYSDIESKLRERLITTGCPYRRGLRDRDQGRLVRPVLSP